MGLSFFQALAHDPCAGFAVLFIFLGVGYHAVAQDARLVRIGQAVGGTVFLVLLLTEKGKAPQLSLTCILGGGITVGATWVVVATIDWLVHWLIIYPHQARQQAEERRRAYEKERQQSERYAREQEELARHQQALRALQLEAEKQRHAPPPPRLSRKERFAAAKRKYDDMLEALRAAGLTGDELTAASEKARQQYLTEPDQGM